MNDFYAKLIYNWSGNPKDITIEYYDNLEKMVEDCFHAGLKNDCIITKAELIGKEEYQKNYLPF